VSEALRVYVEDLMRHQGAEVEIRGWLYNRRRKGKVLFLLVRDGTGIVQCVTTKPEIGEETFVALDHLPLESSLIVRGKVRADKRAPGGYEIAISSVEIVSTAQEYPIGKKEHGVDFLLGLRHLWIRSRKQWAILRIRSRLIRAIYDFFFSRGFVLFDAPILTPTACEGTTTLFEVNYFDRKAYLTQSGQLYGEAGAMAFGKIFVFGPTFRAEKSKTRRHLTEFWMVEPEVAYATLDDMMKLAEEFVSEIVAAVVQDCTREFEVLERNTDKLKAVKPPFPRITYSEAVQILHQKGHQFEWGDDFGAPEETAISETFEKPVIVHRFPKQIKAFYMEEDPEDPQLVLGFDVLAPEGYGEIIGGGQRCGDIVKLRKRIEEMGLREEVFEWYLDLRRYGSVPHAGFGLGVERTVAWICGIHHVREAIPFPRTIYRLEP